MLTLRMHQILVAAMATVVAKMKAIQPKPMLDPMFVDSFVVSTTFPSVDNRVESGIPGDFLPDVRILRSNCCNANVDTFAL